MLTTTVNQHIGYDHQESFMSHSINVTTDIEMITSGRFQCTCKEEGRHPRSCKACSLERELHNSSVYLAEMEFYIRMEATEALDDMEWDTDEIETWPMKTYTIIQTIEEEFGRQVCNHCATCEEKENCTSGNMEQKIDPFETKKTTNRFDN